ncbi:MULTISPECIES: Hepatitis C virus core protein [unclassified Cyanobium]|uniref:Hepatitis C virus core protein n=1 Tax=unclassified Cyanobium TaxID=2627006 RepID=UPI0020CE7569|nr:MULTISPECIES: Hepatitis C virus core protein [unclassified Cyanobium]MCP9835217.1 Hepatitis C virus core protein [Cyanobium sp. La Preciosa 7G6]MCP9937982.1 Hepatitis C virus core protein [Cyanobium sp. Aljojuca 7A6]
MQTLFTTPDALAELQPPRGYRTLAWLGLVTNLMVLPLGLAAILLWGFWRTANVAIYTSAVLPAVALGVVACIALLKWRLWGQVLAIVALSLDLAIEMAYGIVRMALVGEGRLLLAVAAPLVWGLTLAALVFWCRPSIRSYLS